MCRLPAYTLVAAVGRAYDGVLLGVTAAECGRAAGLAAGERKDDVTCEAAAPPSPAAACLTGLGPAGRCREAVAAAAAAEAAGDGADAGR